MTEENQPPNLMETLARLAKQQAEQQEKLDLLAKAVIALSEKPTAQPQKGQGGGGLGDLIAALRGLAGEGGGSKVSLKQIAESARYWAMLSDALDHYRRPTLPYSGADRFLMRAGARTVYRLTYQGVKSKPEEAGEEPNDEEIDRMLGFAEEKKEEKANKHV